MTQNYTEEMEETVLDTGFMRRYTRLSLDIGISSLSCVIVKLCYAFHDGGDAYMVQQDDIEEAARAELWREELIEEIEQKVGGLQELEEAGRK